MASGTARAFWRKAAVAAVVAAPVAIFVTDNVVSLQMISGRSMQPALNPDSNLLRRDVVLVDRMVQGEMAPRRLRRGDIVTLVSPYDPDLLLVKRIIAMPHDCVVPLGKPNSFVRVPKGHCWVEGDESFHSGDSTSFGPVSLALIRGRALTLVWPPSRFGASLAGLPEWKKSRVYANGVRPLTELKRRWDRSQAADEHVALSTELAATSFDSELAEPASGSAELAVLHSSAAALDDPHGRRPDSETLPEHHDPPMSEPPRKLGAPAEFTADVDINDSDNRQMLAKSSTHISIAEATGVEVATRGRHYADASEASSADPALHLHLEATSQDMLDRAIEMIEVMKGDGPAIAHSHSLLYADGVDGANYAHSDQQLSGRQSSADGGQQRLQDKVYVEVESVRGFNVRAKLIGTGGENMKYIQNTTGARVQVRGNGSGCDDNAQ
ncbi:hypothetical protein GGH95_002847, partial [Coemansia sp. RSA 1836]